jgi:hypothetical protein
MRRVAWPVDTTHVSHERGRSLAQRARWVGASAVTMIVFAAFPALLYAAALPVYGDDLGFDLRHSYLPAADHVLNGESPFPPLTDTESLERYAYVYPPLLAFIASPLTLVSGDAASVIGVVLFMALLAATLWLLSVRDWRVYGAVLLWAPTFNAIQNLNVSLPLAFGLAAVWRLRNRGTEGGLVFGVLVAVKLFLWPLAAWLLAARRVRATFVAAGLVPVLVFAPWAAIGFDGLGDYRALLERFTELNENDSYAVSAAVAALGAPQSVGRGVAIVAFLALLAAAVVVGRRGDDRRSFTYALAAALVLPPILWQHYLMLLIVPLALSRPRLSLAWLLPTVLWIAPQTENGAWWQTLLVPGVAAALVAVCVVPSDWTRGLVGMRPLARRAAVG